MRLLLSIIAIGLLLAACGSPSSPVGTNNSEAVRAFHVGLAALQVGDDVRAKDELTKATQLASNEPAAWVNLGIFQIRHKDFEAARASLERARTLAPNEPRIYETIALLEKQRGNFDASQAALQRAIDLNANNVKAIYALAKEKERQLDDSGARTLYEKLLDIKRENLEVRLEAIRLAAKQDIVDEVKRLFAGVKARPDWEQEIRTQFDALQSAVSAGDSRAVLTQVSFFRNTLLRDSQFRASIAEVKYSDTTLGEPIAKPLVLQTLPSVPAPADTGLTFETKSSGTKAIWSRFVYLTGDAAPAIAYATEAEIRIGDKSIPFSVENPNGMAVFDFDYDFKNDIALAGKKGFRIFRQTDNGFSEVLSPQNGASVRADSYAGVWPIDIESDGDLDLALARENGTPLVMQNNSDSTFEPLEKFSEASKVRQFVSFDVDEDGDVDVVTVDADSNVHYFSNERGGVFRKQEELHKSASAANATSVSDINSDGRLDFVHVSDSGVSPGFVGAFSGDRQVTHAMASLSLPRQFCQVHETLQEIKDANGRVVKYGKSRSRNCVLHAADFDNNGANDFLVSNDSETLIYLGKGRRLPESSSAVVFGDAVIKVPGRVFDLGDEDGDGRIDLVGTVDGVATTFLNRGTKNYNWQTVRPRAAKTTGDQRVNSFGIGGELELRAGLSVQKQPITEPVVHFGLGQNPGADVLRVVWQNGFVQAEFDLKPNQTIAAEQRLKGSCPHLFAFDGESFKLVKDAPPWSPALGLKINAQDTFGILQTEEWFKVPGEALKPTSENFYELRITAEYWESFYIDHYSLLVVDHPENTEVFTDERFSVRPPPLEVFTTGKTYPFAAARNDNGDDVTAIVRTLDERYLDGFELGTFQGVAKDHFVEMELPTDAPADKKVAIIADGWVHPTDASINVQLGQSSREKPRSLSLEVRDENGEWKVAKENLGFPAGKMKTLVIELPAGARAARLRTNMEIFWDKLAWAVYEDADQNKFARLDIATSELRYRGFSVVEKANDSSPEKPVYDRLLTTAQRWRDMEGYFTRFGDVRELLLGTDGRFVLANAGDEIVLKFPAMPPPPAGYKRDFVLIGNGWIKDGDLNSVFSKTLLPLPRHETNDYSTPPTTLEADPVYRKHRTDWLNFHTRYVSPDGFRNALRK